MSTITANVIHDLPMPAGAVKVYEWINPGTDYAFRAFDSDRWSVPCDGEYGQDIEVWHGGVQYGDGSDVYRDIYVHQTHADDPLTITQARKLRDTLSEVIAEVEQLDRR